MKATRYRFEEGRPCIDVHVKTAQHLFDNRDPAPFRERDLDEDAVDYILGAAEELTSEPTPKIVLFISEEASPIISNDTVTQAIHAHLAYELEKLERKRRQHVRQGQLTLVAGLLILATFLTLAELTSLLATGHLRQILREGLVIIGWVGVWRPVEVLLYDWLPLIRQRRLLTRLLALPVSIVRGAPSDPERGRR